MFTIYYKVATSSRSSTASIAHRGAPCARGADARLTSRRVRALSAANAGQHDVSPGVRELADLDFDQSGDVPGERLLERGEQAVRVRGRAREHAEAVGETDE